MRKDVTEQRTVSRKVSFNCDDKGADSELEESGGEHDHEFESVEEILPREDGPPNE